ncbi:MAG: hypothetical protein AAFZ18_11485 [Myxococcota bacterium]
MGYRNLCSSVSLLTASLFLVLLLSPGALTPLFGIGGEPDYALIARRAAFLFAGYAVSHDARCALRRVDGPRGLGLGAHRASAEASSEGLS